MIVKNDAQYNLLKYIYQKNKQDKPFSQRDIAKALSISVGMTNEIIKKAFTTGFLKIKRINTKTLHYLLTLEGIQYIANKTQKYLKRIIKNAALYKKAIDSLINSKKANGITKIILIGESDIEFIVEYCCLKNGIEFTYIKNFESFTILPEDHKRNVLILYSETCNRDPFVNNSSVINLEIEIAEAVSENKIFNENEVKEMYI